MDDLFLELNKDIETNRLVIMPIDRIVFDYPIDFEGYYFFPPGSFSIESLRPIPNRTIVTQASETPCSELNDVLELNLSGQTLREVSTSLTGFSKSTINENYLVAFIAKVDWDSFLKADHQEDIELLKSLSAKAEKAIDLIRLEFCRLDLPDTLPGLAGSWNGSGSYLGAMIYSAEDNESYLIAGEAIECSAVIKGIGLELDHAPTAQMPRPREGEVSAIASYGLSLLSEAMSSSNETIKFIRMMTLFEFLASPDTYERWQKAKTKIACHVAESKTEYLGLLERFKELASNIVNGNEIGYRTLIIHQGKQLPDLIRNIEERKTLFRELQGYSSIVLEDMIDHRSMDWLKYCERREFLKKELGVKN